MEKIELELFESTLDPDCMVAGDSFGPLITTIISNYVPRQGETLILSDGREFRVNQVHWRSRTSNTFEMMACVRLIVKKLRKEEPLTKNTSHSDNCPCWDCTISPNAS